MQGVLKVRLWNSGNVEKRDVADSLVRPMVGYPDQAVVPSFLVEKFSNPQMFVKNFGHLEAPMPDVGRMWDLGAGGESRLVPRNDFAVHGGGKADLHTFHRFVEESDPDAPGSSAAVPAD